MVANDDVYAQLDEAYAALEADDPAKATEILDRAAETGPEVPELHYLRGQIAVDDEDYKLALERYARAIELDPGYADAHYAAAQAARSLDDEAAARAHELKVYELDAEADAQLSEEEQQEVLQLIEGAAEQTLANLPERFAAALREVPILVEARPALELVKTGFDPRALGLFDGPTHATRTGTEPPPSPTHIVLFWTNILDIVDDEEHLAEEVEITLLHEIAHYFGLDEEEVAELGLA